MHDKARLLIIEDEPDTAQLIANLAQVHGFETMIAHSGEEGIEAARQCLPNLLFLDLMLPGLSGFDVCRILHQQAGWSVPIVFVTALNSQECKNMSVRLGASGYITKPFGVDDITRVFAPVLSQFRGDG